MEIEIDIKPTILVIHKQSKASSDKTPSVSITSESSIEESLNPPVDIETGLLPSQLKKIGSPPAPIAMVMVDDIQPERPLTDFLTTLMNFIAHGWGHLRCENCGHFYLLN
jgi:hypothetical protein